MEIDQALDRYLELHSQKAAIEKEMKTLSTSILLQMDESTPSIPWDGRTIARMERISYSYSPAVAELEKEVKAAKKEEEKAGIAEPSVTVYLRVTTAKTE